MTEIAPIYNKALKEWEQDRNLACQHLMPDEFTKWLNEHPRLQLSKKEHTEILNNCLEKAQKVNKKRKSIFCPIAKSECQIECECYEKATVRGTIYEKDILTDEIQIPLVSGGYCTAYMLKGKED